VRNRLDLVEFELENPMRLQYNLTLQREVLRDTVATVGYLGSRGYHQIRNIEANQAVPQIRKRVRVNWHEGTMFVPPIYWYHQHLNPGDTAARYLAINAPGIVRSLGLRFEDQIEPDLPEIEQEFKAEVAKAAKPKQ
jgi:hypothetical protein